MTHTAEQLKSDLKSLGVAPGDTVMMHSSYRSLGGIEQGAKGFFDAFFDLLGETGTLMLPAFSYATVGYASPVFDRQNTPSCVGYLTEYFRTSVPGVVRSMHATHSCCVKGRHAEELIKDHQLDLTPVGDHSPITRLPRMNGKILFLGCSPNHNTALHGVEERVRPVYLFNETPICYRLKDGDRTIEQTALHHGFYRRDADYLQRYERVLDLLAPDECRRAKVLDADCFLLSAQAVWDAAYRALKKDPLYFVDVVPKQP